ncbi:hypothetical protein EVAR_103500_1 [Eumeta japonica]|uniref:Uncharacterized protein n=1 Tax=Eumeta variegata TaxID=151549 RepID=A0A4C1SXQ9_EUMVA|nr:hypothetical protein EVAR_103500_1 [Eumeta japonica]
MPLIDLFVEELSESPCRRCKKAARSQNSISGRSGADAVWPTNYGQLNTCSPRWARSGLNWFTARIRNFMAIGGCLVFNECPGAGRPCSTFQRGMSYESRLGFSCTQPLHPPRRPRPHFGFKAKLDSLSINNARPVGSVAAHAPRATSRRCDALARANKKFRAQNYLHINGSYATRSDNAAH